MKHLLILTLATIMGFAVAQDPWPMERKDRWGTARQDVGPGMLTKPWLYRVMNMPGGLVSHGASLGADGIGYFGSWVTNRIFEFDIASANVLRTFDALNFVTSVPAIGPSNRLYATCDSGSAKLYALDRTLFDYDWFDTVGANGGGDFEHGSPVIGPGGDPVFGANSGRIRRYNQITGAVVWQRTDMQGMSRTNCFSRDDTKVFVANGNRISALSWSDGSVAWHTSIGGSTGAPGTAPDGTVIVGSDTGILYGLNPGTGAILWSRAFLGAAESAPAFSADGVAYVTSADRRLYAIRVTDGSRLWSYTGTSENLEAPSVGHDGTIYFCDRSGILWAVNPNGTLKWQKSTGGESRGPLTIGADGRLYVPSMGAPGGLFVYRQDPAEVDPTSIQVLAGSILSGGVPDLLTSDNQKVRFLNNGPDLLADVLIKTTSPIIGAAKLTYSFEGSVEVPGLVQQLYLYNYGAGRYDSIDGRIAPVADLTLTVEMTANASQYIKSNGEMIARVKWSSINDADPAQDGWYHEIDRVHWTVVSN